MFNDILAQKITSAIGCYLYMLNGIYAHIKIHKGNKTV